MSAMKPSTLHLFHDEERLGRLVLERNVVTLQELDLAREQARANRLELYRVLLNLNLVTVDQLNELAATASNGTSGEMNGRPLPALAKQPLHSPPPVLAQAMLDEDDEDEEDLSDVAAGVALADAGDIPGLVEQLLGRAINARATDIHLDPMPEHRLRIRFRIDGQLHDILQLPANRAQAVVSRLKLMSAMDIIEKRDAQDGHLIATINGKTHNLRIATIPTHRGERLVARILDETVVSIGLDHLGFNDDQRNVVNAMLKRPYGILIVTGPVGSGKTTTLYSCLTKLNNPTRNVMTIEDPVEYTLPGVNQCQVDAKNEWTFPKALRGMLRQDPNILMVGEIRDDETAQISVRAALTGVLVLTSMHANDAASTVSNLFSFGIPGYLVSGSLLGVVAQRLVRKINQDSYEEFAADQKMRELLRLEDNEHPNLMLRRGVGTAEDFGTGYLGRTGVFEVLEVDEIIRDMIFRETNKDVLRQVAIDNGMLPLVQHAINKVIAGITTIEEVYRVALM